MEIIVPNGFMGASSNDSPIDMLIREASKKYGDEQDWPEKYGTNFENDLFKIHPFCWCEKEDCPYCRADDPEPNFVHKRTGIKVWWYKYIGRSMKYSFDPTLETIEEIIADLKHPL